MTGDSFQAFVADPSRLDNESLLLLKELNTRYPFFRASQLLLAKNLRDLQHIDQRKQLHLAAIHASDRTLFQALLDGRHPVLVNKSENHGPDKGSLTGLTAFPVGRGENSTATDGFITSKPHQKEPVLDGEVGKVESSPITPKPPKIPPVSTKAENDNNAEFEEALNPPNISETGMSINNENLEEVNTTNEKSGSDLHDLIAEHVLYRVEDLLLQEPLSSVKEEKVTEDESAAGAIPDVMSFDQWITRLSAPSSEQKTPSESERPSPPEITPPSHRLKKDLKDNIALIEDFLVSQPREGKSKRAEFFKPSRAAELSNTNDLDAVSETLANIYLTQGQHELAAKAFDALAKRFPEKSSYFAVRKTEAQQNMTGQ